jgi:hypothetical protein
VPGLCLVTFSPDGRWLLTTSGGCRLWQVGSWQEGPKVGGASGCFSPDGRFLAVDDSAGAIRLLRPDSGAQLARLEAPEQTRLQPACFTPDGTMLIAIGIDTQALHIWDLGALHRGLVELGLAGDALLRPAGVEPADAPSRSKNDPRPIVLDIVLSEPWYRSEAEDLPIIDLADCNAMKQDMRPWNESQWSHDRQLLCHARDGGFVELAVDFPRAAGANHLHIYFTRAPDFGIVEVSLDGKKVGSRFDAFGERVVPSGKIDFGVVQLTSGPHRVRFTATGRNPASTDYRIGIDCLELKPAK